jgi:hypothetical protein
VPSRVVSMDAVLQFGRGDTCCLLRARAEVVGLLGGGGSEVGLDASGVHKP